MNKQRASLGVFKTPQAQPQAPDKTERPDRIGRTVMPFWTTKAAKKQLRIMAAEEETTQQDLMSRALNDFFKKHGKPPIA